ALERTHQRLVIFDQQNPHATPPRKKGPAPRNSLPHRELIFNEWEWRAEPRAAGVTRGHPSTNGEAYPALENLAFRLLPAWRPINLGREKPSHRPHPNLPSFGVFATCLDSSSPFVSRCLQARRSRRRTCCRRIGPLSRWSIITSPRR